MWNLVLDDLLYNYFVALSNIRNGVKMIDDEEIKIIMHDLLCHTRELLKFLRSIKVGKYNAYLDDLINYIICTEEDIQTIEHYIYELEMRLYNALKGGEY